MGVIGYFEPIPEEEQESAEGVEFVSRLSGQEIPNNFVPSIEKGFRTSAAKGFLTGHPVINIRNVLLDGAAHDVDSSDQAFQAASAGAFEKFFEDANPVVLEPLMAVEVTYPSEFQPQTLQTINGREGSISSTQAISGDSSVVEAIVPLRRMFGYSSELRSVTQGMGEFSMEFKEYEAMPGAKQEELMANIKGVEEKLELSRRVFEVPCDKVSHPRWPGEGRPQAQSGLAWLVMLRSLNFVGDTYACSGA